MVIRRPPQEASSTRRRKTDYGNGSLRAGNRRVATRRATNMIVGMVLNYIFVFLIFGECVHSMGISCIYPQNVYLNLTDLQYIRILYFQIRITGQNCKDNTSLDPLLYRQALTP